MFVHTKDCDSLVDLSNTELFIKTHLVSTGLTIVNAAFAILQ